MKKATIRNETCGDDVFDQERTNPSARSLMTDSRPGHFLGPAQTNFSSSLSLQRKRQSHSPDFCTCRTGTGTVGFYPYPDYG